MKNSSIFIFKTAVRCLMVVGIVTLFVASCNEDNSEKVVYNPNKPLILTSFKPDSGRIREMVLLDGENFGSETSLIKVFFNEREAKVIGSTGERILAAVPRLPGDTCAITVEIGNQRKEYFNRFRYKVEASVTTIAGNGTANPKIFDQGLDKAQFQPIYIGTDLEYNIFVSDPGNYLLRINEDENLIQIVATPDMGYNHRCQIQTNPLTNVLQMGAEGPGNRDRFAFFDPKKGWSMSYKFIREWDLNNYPMPEGAAPVSPGSPNNFETHYHCLYCELDGMYYTRYHSGAIVRIDPETWKAKIIGMTPIGISYGTTLHPINKGEMWIGYDGQPDANAGIYAHAICRVNLLDETVGSDGLLASFEKLSAPGNAAGHRDGPISQAQFNVIRGITFDPDGNLFISEWGNHCVRMINTMSKPMMVETTIGIPGLPGWQDGNKETALFRGIHGITSDADGTIYVSDYNNCRVRKIAIE